MRKKSRTWRWIDQSRVFCYADPRGDQQLAGFIEPAQLSVIHDEGLGRCTAAVNATLRKTDAKRPGATVRLAILKLPQGFFLAWTENRAGAIPKNLKALSGSDDPSRVATAFQLRARRRRSTYSWLIIGEGGGRDVLFS